MNDPDCIVHSSDSYPVYYPPNTPGNKFPSGVNPVYNAKAEAKFWLKDVEYSLYDMVGAR